MKCRNCGFILRRGQTVCPACGQKNEASSGRAEANRFVLPIVLGALVVLMAVIVVISVRGKLSARKAGMPSDGNEGVTQSAVVTPTPEATPAPTPTPEPQEYLLPDSATRYLTEADISFLSHRDLCLARNEIFARHGRIFKTPEIAAYFQSMDWYRGTIQPDQFDNENWLSDIEKANIKLIQQYEDRVYGGSYY